MAEPRKSFRRGTEQERKLSLIRAAQACVIDGGIRRATVRRIAAVAEVTPGLIRHYFPGKDELLREAYRHTMREMTEHCVDSLEDFEGGAVERLHQFVRSTLSAPVMSAQQHQLWASFTSLTGSMPAFAQVHQESYLDFRRECSRLVQDVLIEQQQSYSAREVEQIAVAVNAQLDGLWLEGCLAIELFDAGEIAQIGIRSVDALLRLATKPN